MFLLVGCLINWSEMLCSPRWSATHYLAQDSLEPKTIFLPSPPKCCDYRHKLYVEQRKSLKWVFALYWVLKAAQKMIREIVVDWSPEKKCLRAVRNCAVYTSFSVIVFLISPFLQMTKLRHTVRNQVVVQKPSSEDHKWLSCPQIQRH